MWFWDLLAELFGIGIKRWFLVGLFMFRLMLCALLVLRFGVFFGFCFVGGMFALLTGLGLNTVEFAVLLLELTYCYYFDLLVVIWFGFRLVCFALGFIL